MTTLMTIALIGAAIVSIGAIIYLYLGFTQRILWGLAILLLPYVELIFTAFHWQRARTAFFMYVIGHVMFLGAAFGGATEQYQDFLYESEAGYTRSLYTEEELLKVITDLDSFRFGNFEPKPGALTPQQAAEQRGAEERAREQQEAEEEKRQTAELEGEKQQGLDAIMEKRAQEDAEFRQKQADKDELRRKRAAKARDAIIEDSTTINEHRN